MDCNSSQGSTSLSLYKIHYRIFLKWLVSSFRKPRDCWFSSRTCPRIRRILFIRLCPSLMLIYFGFPPLLNPLPPSYHCFPAKLNWSFFDPLRTIPPLLLNLPKSQLSLDRPTYIAVEARGWKRSGFDLERFIGWVAPMDYKTIKTILGSVV